MRPGFQQQIWANGAGDDWLERNRDKLGERDVASEIIQHVGLQPKSVLEIGCSNGWRLKKMKEKYGCKVAGIDVAPGAIKEAKLNGLNVHRAGADNLPYKDGQFDMVIYGFCLCFISPEDWMRMVNECDRVLQNDGHVVVYDFVCTAFVKRRMMKITGDAELEKEGLYLFNYDWPKLWTGHPAYRIKANMFNLNFAEVATVIHKTDLLFDLDENGGLVT